MSIQPGDLTLLYQQIRHIEKEIEIIRRKLEQLSQPEGTEKISARSAEANDWQALHEVKGIWEWEWDKEWETVWQPGTNT